MAVMASIGKIVLFFGFYMKQNDLIIVFYVLILIQLSALEFAGIN